MFKALVLCLSLILGQSLASVETNKRGGHGIFHGLEDKGGKTSWLEESKVDHVKISKGNTNSLLSNTDVSSKKSSLYLQPEPRGLEYLLNVPDQNPLLMNFYRRRRESSFYSNKLRKTRQIYVHGQPVDVNNQGIPSGPNQNIGLPSGYYPNTNNPQHTGGYKTYGY